MTSSSERDLSREMVGAMHRSSGAYELVIGAVAAAALGFGLDSLAGTRPVFTLVFAAAGFVGASYSIWLNYRLSMQTESDRRAARVAGDRHVNDRQLQGLEVQGLEVRGTAQ